MNRIIPSVAVDGHKFTASDVAGAVVMGAGSFGASIKITNSAAQRSFVIKILGGKYVDYAKESSEFMMETYMGYYITQHKLKNFNKVFSYFKTSSINSDVYFSSIDNTVAYRGAINNNDPVVRKGDILIIIIDAGDGSLSSFIEDAKIIYNTDKVKVIEQMTNINKQMLNISKISICSKVSKDCIYVTHNDVKPENMIFRKTGVSPNIRYNMEFIDYGGLLYSDSFFKPIDIHTPYYISMVYDNSLRTSANDPLRIASPLYDIGSVIFSMLIMIYDDVYAPNASLQNLKRLYAEVPNLERINGEYQILQSELKKRVQRKLFGSEHIDIPYAAKNAIISYVKRLLHYINLALCINGFMYIYDIEFRNDAPNNYKNVDFVNFELMDLKNSLNSVIASGYKSFTGLRNLELLDRIIVEVERNVDMT
jgi:serine/threonine protein kinase